jgi:hypothetical protein
VRGNLLIAENHFALADQLVIQPQPVFKSCAFNPGPGRTAQQPHACRSLKYIGGKWAPVSVELDPEIPSVRQPGDLVAIIKHHNLGNYAYKYRPLSHYFSNPCEVMLLKCLVVTPRAKFRNHAATNDSTFAHIILSLALSYTRQNAS